MPTTPGACVIRRIDLGQVIVPARADAVNSPEVDHPLHKLPLGARPGWTQPFDGIPKIIIQVRLANGAVGLGETYRGVAPELTIEIARGLLGLDLAATNLRALPLPQGRAYDGFECALVDALTRALGVPLHQWLGGAFRNTVRCSFWTGHRTAADAVRKAREARVLGYDCIKLKCRRSDPIADWCEAIASACGGLSIVLDPNERLEYAAEVERLAPRLAAAGNLLCLEDPIPRWNLEAWRALRAKVRLPLALHVALPYLEQGQQAEDAVRAVRLDACDFFNFNGGIYGVARLAALADVSGIPYWHGSEVDLGILEASYVHKSAAFERAELPADIFGRLIREHDLLREPLHLEAGRVAVPKGPGLGVELEAEALAHYRTARWTIEP